MIRMMVAGDTYKHKDELKSKGFRWNSTHSCWLKWFDNDGNPEAKELLNRYNFLGLRVLVEMAEAKPKDKTYFVKESWIFNLESMHDKIWCMIYDIREDKLSLPLTVANKTINDEDDLFELLDEAERLECIAKHGKVTGEQYGRIKALVTWRVEARYARCLASGMSEADAGKCFEDI